MLLLVMCKTPKYKYEMNKSSKQLPRKERIGTNYAIFVKCGTHQEIKIREKVSTDEMNT